MSVQLGELSQDECPHVMSIFIKKQKLTNLCPSSHSLSPTDVFLDFELYINGITEYGLLGLWLLPFNIMGLRFILLHI